MAIRLPSTCIRRDRIQVRRRSSYRTHENSARTRGSAARIHAAYGEIPVMEWSAGIDALTVIGWAQEHDHPTNDAHDFSDDTPHLRTTRSEEHTSELQSR